jgi:hypothetical protein
LKEILVASIRRIGIASWAVTGVGVVLLEPALRLGLFAARRLSQGLTASEWLALVSAVIALGYVEGHRGFRCSFCPRVVGRAFELADRPRGSWLMVMAPAYALSLIGDSRARVARAWALGVLILPMVYGVRMLPPTWRAIVDAAVAFSLGWGVLELCTGFARHLRVQGRPTSRPRSIAPMHDDAPCQNP